jgi:hypothetical protein
MNGKTAPVTDVQPHERVQPRVRISRRHGCAPFASPRIGTSSRPHSRTSSAITPRRAPPERTGRSPQAESDSDVVGCCVASSGSRWTGSVVVAAVMAAMSSSGGPVAPVVFPGSTWRPALGPTRRRASVEARRALGPEPDPHSPLAVRLTSRGQVVVVAAQQAAPLERLVRDLEPLQPPRVRARRVGEHVAVAAVGLGLARAELRGAAHHSPRHVGDRYPAPARDADRHRPDRAWLVDHQRAARTGPPRARDRAAGRSPPRR